MSEVFTFVDATHLIAKANLWQERDRAIKAKLDKLNNEVLLKVASDNMRKLAARKRTNTGTAINSIALLICNRG
jgi:transposase, IS5 family